MRPLVVDCFPFHDELDVLEMRLTELYDAVDAFVLVEADVTHQDQPKPYHYMENRERFAPWADKIVAVQATGLPTLADDPNAWARELAQREHIASGLRHIDLDGATVVLQSDVDEIPRSFHARNIRPSGFAAFHQRGHFWAVDWLYPPGWNGTVAATVSFLGSLNTPTPFGEMRNARNRCLVPAGYDDAGWHFSWLGGAERANKKIASFCHPEVERDLRAKIDDDNFCYREGWHVDKVRMRPVTVDGTWPKWIVDGNAPESWFRPR